MRGMQLGESRTIKIIWLIERQYGVTAAPVTEALNRYLSLPVCSTAV
jgi:hypothetical protein